MSSSRYKILPLLSQAWEIFFAHWRVIVGITLLVYLPIKVIFAFLPWEFGPGYEQVYTQFIDFVQGFLTILATMAIAFVVKNVRDNKPIDMHEALGAAFSRWGVAVWVHLIMGVALFFLFLLFIVPGIIYKVYWLFVPWVIIYTQKEGKEVLSYTKSLVTGQWGTVLRAALSLCVLEVILLFVVQGIPVTILTVYTGVFAHSVFSTGLSIFFALVNEISASFFLIAWTLLFFEVVKRKEAETRGEDNISPEAISI